MMIFQSWYDFNYYIYSLYLLLYIFFLFSTKFCVLFNHLLIFFSYFWIFHRDVNTIKWVQNSEQILSETLHFKVNQNITLESTADATITFKDWVYVWLDFFFLCIRLSKAAQ